MEEKILNYMIIMFSIISSTNNSSDSFSQAADCSYQGTESVTP